MQKLQRPGEGPTTAGAAMPPAASYGTGANALQPMPASMPQSAAATAPAVKQERTILLRNMFAPEDAKADEDFEEEMKEDITGECAKFGRIEHVKVDKVCMASLPWPKFHTLRAACCWWSCVDERMCACVVICHQNSMGLVYLKFEAVAGGAAALNALNGRWFAGKMITAEFYNEAQYNAKFGL
jgi:RNA-binding protein 39